MKLHIPLFFSFYFISHGRADSSDSMFASVTLGVSSVFAVVLYVGLDISCHFSECCNNDKWMLPNFSDNLTIAMRDKLYGQHLVNGPVQKHLKAHSKKNPSKALVLSFHGRTGTGKNFVSQLAVDSIYKLGMKSKFVHLISATTDFPHMKLLQQYKDKLRNMIETSVKACERSFFIFDEMDKMPVGLIDTIKPYVDYHESFGGVDYRKATFFFLSNVGGNDIAKRTLEHWIAGLDRETITLKEMEEVIQLPAYNTESGLYQSELVSKNLITAYIPFLPLERSHVKECIRDAMVAKGYFKPGKVSETKVQEVADELTYYPKGLDVFSSTGCKRVHEKVDLVMEDIHKEL